MGMSVKVPGGWMGTRSVGVRAGPVSLGTRHSGPLNGLLTLICLPIYALTVAVTALAAVLWIVGWTLKAVIWVATWTFKTVAYVAVGVGWVLWKLLRLTGAAVKGGWWLIVTPCRLAWWLIVALSRWTWSAVRLAWSAGRWVVHRFRRPQRWAAPDPMARVG